MVTINKTYIKTTEVMKSRFVAIAIPFDNADDFKTLHQALKKEHAKARHLVYAYRVGDKSKSCDDQEPHGTAGRPLLELLQKKNLNNIIIFVARYFGGVKLGAGRLLRTYLQSGINVLNDAELIEI
jgi:uncharacterized YigZ family protein